VVQANNKVTDTGGRMIAESLKGNCSVTEVRLVSAGLLSVGLLLLTCVGQGGNKDMSEAVKREITQALHVRHGADKGIVIYITADSLCRFFDFRTCEEIDLPKSKVRLLSLHDAA